MSTGPEFLNLGATMRSKSSERATRVGLRTRWRHSALPLKRSSNSS